MKFICERTSESIESKPCEDSIKEELKSYICRTKPKSEMIKLCPNEDFSYYEDFTNKNGNIWCRREIKTVRYTIEIENIEQLLCFIDKHGSIVIREDEDEILPIIEIYDTWRE